MQPTILHAIDTTGPGGAETVFLDLAQHLQVQNHATLALVKGPGWVLEQLQKRNIDHIVLKPHGFLSIPYYIALVRLIKKKRVALVQAHLLGSALTFAIVCRICGVPLVATLHGQVDINPRERLVFVKQWLLATGVRCIVAVSKNLAAFIQTRGLFAKQHIKIVYNGIDTSRYYRAKNRELAAGLKISSGAILVGSLGNVRPAKNYELLIESAAVMVHGKKMDHVHFLVAGHQKKDLMQRLNELAKARKVAANVHFLGFLDDTPKYLSELDIFLLTSSSEGFSIATIEAMAAGVPVVATRCGGPEEIVSNGQNGILLDANTPQAVANALAGLIENKAKASALVASAKDHVAKYFSLEAMITCYQHIYGTCLGKSHGTGKSA